MKKMGLFGGSFDPIHKGHVSMALRLAERLDLDGVVLMPTFVPPHKIKENMASADHRLVMCRLAAEEHPLLLTIGECVDNYINSKENILSPKTIYVYRQIRNNGLADLCPIPVSEITNQRLQAHINQLSLNVDNQLNNVH